MRFLRVDIVCLLFYFSVFFQKGIKLYTSPLAGIVLIISRNNLGYPISSTGLASLSRGIKINEAKYLSRQLTTNTRRYFDQKTELYLTIRLPVMAPANIETPLITL